MLFTFWKMRKSKYKVNPNAKKVAGIPKKSKKADMRRHSTVIFLLALSGLIWGTYYAFIHKTIEYHNNGSTGVTTTTVVQQQPNSNTEDGEVFILKDYSVEQVENLANTIAGQNAIWPGYKGDPKDHQAVQRHFNEQFAKFINSGVITTDESRTGKTVTFAYAVTADGVIVFVGRIPGGTIDDNRTYVEIAKGISGRVAVTPAQDESGENIIMLYYIKVRFAIA